MPKILLVLPTLDYSGAGTQAALLAEALSCDRYQLHVCALGDDGPVAERLAARVPVTWLGRFHCFNLAACWRWRGVLRRFQPNVIHTWGAIALRLAALSPGRRSFRLIASSPLPPREGRHEPDRVDRWLLHRAHVVVARASSEAERFARFGVPRANIVIVPPGVETCEETLRRVSSSPVLEPPDPLCNLPPARRITCVGALLPHKGFRDAIWAFDILHFLYPDLHLVLIGAGPDRQRLERFSRGVGPRENIHFAGKRGDIGALLKRSEIVWVPSLAETGVNVALEAMAQGVPVVASRLACLAEVVRDGETGLLFSPGDKVELARRTRMLLDDAARARCLGEAGRQRASDHFGLAKMVEVMARVYGERTTSGSSLHPLSSLCPVWAPKV
jgi:glycosyltransferase involved in cell wall biosynthesis